MATVIKGELAGPRVQEQRAAYTSRTAAPPRRRSSGQQSSRNSRPIRDYGPTRVADSATSGIGLLEAEYFIIIFLLILQLFAGSGSYGDKMVSTMKRGTLVTLLFFFLAMFSAVGPNAMKVAKGIGGLVLLGILLSTPGEAIITALDNFAKADWVGNTGSSADTGTSTSTGGALSRAEQAANNSSNTITEIQLPGIGPVFALQKVAEALKGLLHL